MSKSKSKSKEDSRSLFDPAIIKPAIGASFKKLSPRDMMKNPVMFVVEVGTALVSVLYIADLLRGRDVDSKLTLQLIIWLWFTVLFANFAEAVAEGRGKAQAATLRKMRTTTNAFRTRVLSDWLEIEVRQDPGGGFIDRMIALVEGASRQKTPNEIALTILLAGLTIIFLAATAGLIPSARFFAGDISILLLVSLLVCLIPTTIGALLSAIGIAGMDRLVQYNVIATSGRAVEAAGDIDVLMLDKTGTITYGSRQAFELVPATGVDPKTLAEVAMLSSLADETPEGKSIVVLAEKTLGQRLDSAGGTAVPFTAQTRMSGLDLGARSLRKGATDAVNRYVTSLGGTVPEQLMLEVKRIANEGGTPLVVAEGARALGVVYLKDTVKPGMRDRFERLRAMGIKTVMITGDNPLTAKKIAEEAGVDDFLAEATPETKMEYIERMQEGGRLVAMTGDGTNDAPALAKADVGVAMNTGTQAAKEAGNMVDLDSDPTKLIEIVEIGKQLLMTRGALTTFSVANDLAKY